MRERKLARKLDIRTLPDDALLTIPEVCSYLYISRSTLVRFCESGKITKRKVGSGVRFYASDVRACIRNFTAITISEPTAERTLSQ